MKLLVGSTRSRALLERMRELGWGRMFTLQAPTPYPGEDWALDNGVFVNFKEQFVDWKKHEPWNEAKFNLLVDRVDRRVRQAQLSMPLFVVLPDKVADPASLEYSVDWYNRTGAWRTVLPWYLVLQNGMSERDVARVVRSGSARSRGQQGAISGLFLGGDDAFKLTAPSWCRLARRLGVAFHYARVSSIQRLRAAYEMGADSADSAQVLRSMPIFDRYARAWLELTGRGSSARDARSIWRRWRPWTRTFEAGP